MVANIIVGISCLILGGILGIITMCIAISGKDLDE